MKKIILGVGLIVAFLTILSRLTKTPLTQCEIPCADETSIVLDYQKDHKTLFIKAYLNQTTTEHDHSHSDEMVEADSSFVSLMHPEIKGKEDDKCSKCGMAVV